MMARKLNPPGEAYARERVRLGDVDRDGVWEFTDADAAALLGETPDFARYANYFLAIDDSIAEDNVGRYLYPVAKLVDGSPRLFNSALIAQREAAAAASDGAVVELIDQLRSLVEDSADSAAAEGDDASGAPGGPAAASSVTGGGDDGGGKGTGDVPDDIPRSVPRVGAMVRSKSFQIRAEDVDWDARRLTIAFSSETPVDRFFGLEILDHSPGGPDLSRFNSGNAPLLVNHDPDDQVGIVEKAWIDSDRVGRAMVRFGRSARASEILQDVLDGIRQSSSFSYEYMTEPILENPGVEDQPARYRFPKWKGYEVSVVAIPADTAVGVGRSIPNRGGEPLEGKTMSDVKVGETRDDGIKAERDRQANIRSLGRFARVADEEIEKAISEGLELNQWRERVDQLTATSRANTASQANENNDGRIGMSEREIKKFTLFRALRALDDPHNRKLADAAKYEFEMSEAAAKARGVPAKGVLIPEDVLLARGMSRRAKQMMQRTALSVGTLGKGGYTVATEMPGTYIDLLQAQSVVMPLATVMGGLVGDFAFPRLSTAAAGGWVAEGSGATEDTAMAFTQLLFQPKTVSRNIPITRKLLLQTSIDIENVVIEHFAKRNALAIDSAAIKGGGSNEPSGILSGGSIGSVTASGALTWAETMAIVGQVAVDNAMVGDLHWITYPTVWATLKATSRDTGSGLFIIDDNNTIGGFPVHMSSQVPTNLGSGSQTALIFGNMSDVMIGLWGGLDIIVNPYTNATSGTIVIVALQSCDIKLAHDESFAAAQDVTV